MSAKLCPKCGDDRLGVNVLVAECRDIHTGNVLDRWDEGPARPRYTCYCGHEFDAPATPPASEKEGGTP